MCTGGPAAAGGYLDRCGPGPRLPLLVVSPYAKRDYIDHTQTTQASVLRFIEDNWRTGQIGDGSFDATAGSLAGMFDFAPPQQREVLLAANGTVARTVPVRVSPDAGDAAATGSRGPAGPAGSPGAGGPGPAAEPSPAATNRQLAEQAPSGRSVALSAAQVTGGSALLVLLAGGGVLYGLLRRRAKRLG